MYIYNYIYIYVHLLHNLLLLRTPVNIAPFVHPVIYPRPQLSGRLVSLIPGSLIKFVPLSIRFSADRVKFSKDEFFRPFLVVIDGWKDVKAGIFCLFFFFFQLKSLVWGYLMVFVDTLKWLNRFSMLFCSSCVPGPRPSLELVSNEIRQTWGIFHIHLSWATTVWSVSRQTVWYGS